MRKKLEKVMSLIVNEMKKKNAYSYLPEILEILKIMHCSIVAKGSDINEESNHIGGLMRLITEDIEFLESDLGKKIFEIANQYYESFK